MSYSDSLSFCGRRGHQRGTRSNRHQVDMMGSAPSSRAFSSAMRSRKRHLHKRLLAPHVQSFPL